MRMRSSALQQKAADGQEEAQITFLIKENSTLLLNSDEQIIFVGLLFCSFMTDSQCSHTPGSSTSVW